MALVVERTEVDVAKQAAARHSSRSAPELLQSTCALVLAGIAVLARLDWHDLKLGRGALETLIASVFFMGQILWLERKEFLGNRALPVTTVMFGVLAAVSGGMALGLQPGALTGSLNYYRASPL